MHLHYLRLDELVKSLAIAGLSHMQKNMIHIKRRSAVVVRTLTTAFPCRPTYDWTVTPEVVR